MERLDNKYHTQPIRGRYCDPSDQSEARNSAIVPGAHPDTLPDYWDPWLPLITNFSLSSPLLSPAADTLAQTSPGPPPHITILTQYLYLLSFLPLLSGDKTQPGLVMAIILSEFHPSNLIELDNCNFSNLGC